MKVLFSTFLLLVSGQASSKISLIGHPTGARQFVLTTHFCKIMQCVFKDTEDAAGPQQGMVSADDIYRIGDVSGLKGTLGVTHDPVSDAGSVYSTYIWIQFKNKFLPKSELRSVEKIGVDFFDMALGKNSKVDARRISRCISSDYLSLKSGRLNFPGIGYFKPNITLDCLIRPVQGKPGYYEVQFAADAQ